MKLHICSILCKRKILRFFRIKHLFLLTEKGERYEVIEPNGKIKIKHTKTSKVILKNISHKTINIPKRTFIRILKEASLLLEGSNYKLLYRNCYTFVKMFIIGNVITIGLIGGLK